VTTPSVVEQAARILREAQESRTPVEPLTSTFPDLTVADAWSIQSLNREAQLTAGRTVLGYKCGLTSRAMQEQMGVDEPDFGVLLDDMRVPEGGAMYVDRFLQPRIEAEIILVLGRDLGAGTTTADVLAATAYACPSLEIIDSRIKDWRLTLIDTVADNASSGAFVMGEGVPIEGLDLTKIEVVLSVNGVEKARGFGSAALGHPAAAAAWLANRLEDFGLVFGAGAVVMTGSLHASLPVARGDRIVADFGALGSARLSVL
jgi:2-keto-4-pentenoate hydratase